MPLQFKYLILIVGLLTPCIGYAQETVVIKGTITDKEGKAIEGVSVVLNPQNKTAVLAYSMSDGKGYYQLDYSGNVDSLQLALTSFDYEKAIRKILRISQTINFSLELQPISLNEVVIKADPISQKGDTISYLVSAYTSESDRVIGDVLKKLPGIEVMADGSIQYNGKDINKFYVENLDLLQGRYGIATNNISAKDVAAVEVYEYHQPIKVMKETNPTDRAAINLKLKNSAKGTLGAMAQLGAGGKPFLWDNELVSLYFAKKTQNINTYKGNNSGNDVSQELTAFYSDNKGSSYPGNFLSVLSPAPPAINNQRYLFNDVHTATSNLLFLLPKDIELTTNVNYQYDRRTKNSYSNSTYYLPNKDPLTIEEITGISQKINKLNAAIKANSNRNKFYFTNSLNIDALWNRDKGKTITGDTIAQNLKTDLYNLSNIFELIKTIMNGKQFRIYSFNGYVQTPQNLSIIPGMYEEIMTEGKSYNTLMQSTESGSFTSISYVSLSFTKNRFIQNYSTGLEADIQNLNSSLQAFSDDNRFLPNIPDSLKNNLHWQKYKTLFTAFYRYQWKAYDLEIALPLSYNFLHVDDRFPQKKQTENRILFNPYASIMYKLNQNWSFKISNRFNNDIGTIQNTYTGYILNNYRNFNRNEGQLYGYNSNNSTLTTLYRDVRRALFAHLALVYEQFTSDVIREQFFIGNLQLQRLIDKQVKTKTSGLNGNISKNVYALRSTFSLSASYYDMLSSQINQGELVDIKYSTYAIRPKIESNLASWGNLSYSSAWSQSKTTVENKDFHYPDISSIYNRLSIYLFPVKKLGIGINYEHYYDSALSGNEKNMSFIDLNLRYKLKRVDLLLSWTNILDTKQYIRSTFENTGKFVYIYDIRPSQILLTARFKLF
ncbi:hypothetical protein AGMMS50239_09110 [Bacteroidia bacterium]|nr:hypothetical protein AGMMS50239_09110 [Bacteroidia bacterium]